MNPSCLYVGRFSMINSIITAKNRVVINNIVFWGPNLNANKLSGTKGGYHYLSSTWYTGLSV